MSFKDCISKIHDVWHFLHRLAEHSGLLLSIKRAFVKAKCSLSDVNKYVAKCICNSLY